MKARDAIRPRGYINCLDMSYAVAGVNILQLPILMT